MQKVPQPFQYQGSKRALAPRILACFPPGTHRLVEPFAGSAAVSLAAAAHRKAGKFLLNDLNAPLSDLLRAIVERPLETADAYERVWCGQAADPDRHFYTVRDEFNRSPAPELLLYLLARCVKGAVRYNGRGEMNQSPDKRRMGTRPSAMRDNLRAVSALLKGRTEFSALHYRDVLEAAGPGDLVYMDPPYQGVCDVRDARYFSGISHAEFADCLAGLNRRGVPYVVSYDGRRGDKTFGSPLPEGLGLTLVELHAGRSSQSTLLGLDEVTYESLYLSPGLRGTAAVQAAFEYSTLEV